MNIGDTLKFKLRSGQVRTLVLEEKAADVIITNLNELKKDQPGEATLYHFTSNISIDGHSMIMERYVGRPRKGEFARFTPDLEAGKYEVSFTAETPFDPARRAMSPQGQQPVNPELNPPALLYGYIPK